MLHSITTLLHEDAFISSGVRASAASKTSRFNIAALTALSLTCP
jgi:hypothetical protein